MIWTAMANRISSPSALEAGFDARFSHHAGELRAYSAGSNTLVAGDVDGNGRADFQIVLIGHHTLTAGDFIL